MANKILVSKPLAPQKYRRDGWVNITTGLGTTRDKRMGARAEVCLLDQQTIEIIWRGSDLAAKIVEVWPDEMLREGYEICIKAPKQKPAAGELGKKPAPGELEAAAKPPEDKDPVEGRGDAFPASMGIPEPPKAPPGVIEPADTETQEMQEKITSALEELGADDAIERALKYERAYGGAGILLGVDDGATDLSQPLNMDNIRSFSYLTALTCFELFPVAYYNDPLKAKYGEPSVFEIRPQIMPIGTDSETLVGRIVKVHESRLVIFPGVHTSRRQVLEGPAPGWGDSVLVRAHKILADNDLSWSGAAVLLADFAQAVYKFKGLAEAVMGDKTDAIANRMLAIEMQRSVLRGVMLDSEEDFTRVTTPLTGYNELLQQLSLRLAATADIPVTFLMGQAPAGLNATGDSDTRSFYDRVKSKQTRKLKPRHMKIIRILMRAKDGPTGGKEPEVWSIEYKPLWQLTELEQATVRKTQADTDNIYISASVVTPEEIAASRFGGDKYSTDTTIDFEGRQQLEADHAVAQADHEKQKKEAADKLNEQALSQTPTASQGLPTKEKPPVG